jgi:hypothetical protein
MLTEFSMNTQRFGVKKLREPVYDNEALVKFRNKKEIHTFFDNA